MNDISSITACPHEDELSAFAADPLKEEWADLAVHVLACDRCRDALASVIERDEPVVTTPDEDAFIADFTAEHCRDASGDAERIRKFVSARRMAFLAEPVRYSLAAAPASAAGAAAPRAPSEEVRFVFAADGASAAEAWRAELVIPADAAPETMLGVTVTGGGSIPVADGTLRLAGCSLPLEGGSAQLPFSLFLDGICDTDVSLSRAGGRPVAGRLLFF